MVKIRKCLLGVTQLEKAIQAFQGEQYSSIRRCADAFQAPFSTLRGRLNGDRELYLEAAIDHQLFKNSKGEGNCEVDI